MDTVIQVRVDADFKERAEDFAKKAAKAKGASVEKALSAYVREAIAEKIARDAKAEGSQPQRARVKTAKKKTARR